VSARLARQTRGSRLAAGLLFAWLSGSAARAAEGTAPGPRPLAPAERAAVELAGAYLRSGASAWWEGLAADAALRALGREAALAEIAVRAGPPQGALWRLQTPGPRHGEHAAVLAIEFPSGLEETLLLEFTAAEPPTLLGLRSLSDPAAPPSRDPLGLAAAPAPAARGAGGAAAALLALTLLGPRRQRRPALAAALVAALVAATAVSCGRTADAPQASEDADPPAPLVRLAALLPLRQALARGEPAPAAAGEIAAELQAVHQTWTAEELLRQHRLNEARDLLRRLGAENALPLAAVLRARLAVLEGDEGAPALYEQALDLGIDHDGLRLEAAQVAAFLGLTDAAEIVLVQLGEMGSRLAEAHYALAQVAMLNEQGDLGEQRLRIAWALEPLARDLLFADPILAAVVARPSAFPLFELGAVEEPRIAPAAERRQPAALPPGARLRLCGDLLTVLPGPDDATRLEVPGGGALAPASAPVESAEERRQREETVILEEFDHLAGAVAAEGALARPELRRQVERGALALARRNRWPDILQLTDRLGADPARVPPLLVKLRAVALQHSDRHAEAKAVLVTLAKGDILHRRRDPGTFYQLAELFAASEEYDLAIRLLRRAHALAPRDSSDARLRQLSMEQRLVEDSQVLDGRHFSIRYPRMTGDKYARQLARVLEEERRRLARWVRVDGDVQVDVDLFPLEEFLRNYSRGVEVLGLFDGRVRVPFADLRSLHPTLVAILSHELAHALITARTRDQAPRWFQEGLAQHVQMGDQPANPFPELIASGRALAFPVIEAVLAGFSEAQLVDIAYSQAAWTLHFIEQRWGTAAIDRLLDAFAAGRTTEEALRAVLGLGGEAFDRALWDWAGRQAPAAWASEERRYDVEARREELLSGEPRGREEPLLRRGPLAPRGDDRSAAMQTWHRDYAARARPVKAALATVATAFAGGPRPGDLSAACAELQFEATTLLTDETALAAPDARVASELRRGFYAIRAMATACRLGRDAEVHAARRELERRLGAAAALLSPYGLKP
jgi:hypothetical protein